MRSRPISPRTRRCVGENVCQFSHLCATLGQRVFVDVATRTANGGNGLLLTQFLYVGRTYKGKLVRRAETGLRARATTIPRGV